MINIVRLVVLLSILAVGVVVEAAPTVSRSTGVAPLAVHFWADVPASTPGNMPFHDYEYSWNFGDSTSGTWGTSGKSKNTDKGASSAHVYENPGTYTATLTVRNANTGTTVSTDHFTITVTDPEVVYAPCSLPQYSTSGTCTAAGGAWREKTTCISTGSDFTGCPAGSILLPNQSFIPNLSSYTEAGERVLFRRGDSWSTNAEWSLSNSSGPVHIGAFGTCATPDDQGICSNAPSFAVSGGVRIINIHGKDDWRITGLTFTAPKQDVTSVVFGTTSPRNLLLHRVKTTGFGTPIGWEPYYRYPDNNAIVECSLKSTYAYGLYLGSERLMLLGNKIQEVDIQHVVRIMLTYQPVISHNIMSGSSIATTAGLHVLKMHGVMDNAVGGTVTRYRTSFGVLSNNIFGTGGPWPIDIGPASSGDATLIHDMLIEKNRFIAGYGVGSSRLVERGLMLNTRYTTVRNNIFDGRGSSTSYAGIVVVDMTGGNYPPMGNRIYNNTIYNDNRTAAQRLGVDVSSGSVSDTIIRNNLSVFENTTGTRASIYDASGVAVASNNYLGTTKTWFAGPDAADTATADFSLTVLATGAHDAGIAVPVIDDIRGIVRTGTFDIGAYNYGGSTCGPADLGACLTETPCTTAGGYWYDSSCHADPYVETPVCGPTRRDLCLTENDCETTGAGYWWGGLCNANEEPTPTVRTLRQAATGTIRQSATGTVSQ